MKRRTILVVMAAILVGSGALAQSPSAIPPDALSLLQQVSQRYADAKAYHIKSVEQDTQNEELEYNWSEHFSTAAEAPGKRYHFEAQSSSGSALYVSDGKTEWLYNVKARLYTQRPTPAEGASDLSATKVRATVTEALFASHMRTSLTQLAKGYKSATLLPDEVFDLDGRQVPTYVIRLTDADLKKPRKSSETSSEEMIWIDKSKMTVVKQVHRTHISLRGPDQVPIPQYLETIIIYPVTELDPPYLDPTLFSFNPPQDAKLVDKFPEHRRPDLTGNPAPSLSLKAPDGKQVSLASFHGKPVLVDFWATWCAPCVESMPALARLYQQTKNKGLVLLTIDKDEEAKDAIDFLAKKNYPWANFHDDGEASKAFGDPFGIPRTILINGSGKVVYDQSGYDDDELLAAVAGLGPEYAFLSPKPRQEPCVASK